ncbi:hypothetical protein [Salinibacterium sp. PAMC 21357]|uniref:hypothetical protein n=1 Tax=Salinibacterium sp. PAMC 21357 TaxID=1112215 RepID=UPI0002881454|nr:hypothetical protein [Salinibacterium sp. PAMC 21357]
MDSGSVVSVVFAGDVACSGDVGTVGFDALDFGTVGFGTVAFGTADLAAVDFDAAGVRTVDFGSAGFGSASFGAVGFGVVGFGTGLGAVDFDVVVRDPVARGGVGFAASFLGAAGFLAAGLRVAEAVGLAVVDFAGEPSAAVGLSVLTAGFVTSGLTVFLPSSGVWAFSTVQTYQSEVERMSEYHEYATTGQNLWSSRRAQLA